MKTYLAAYPSDNPPASANSFAVAHIAYSIRSMHLMRGRLAVNMHSGIMIIENIDTTPAEGSFSNLSAEIYNECIRHGFDGVIPDFEPRPTSATASYSAKLCDELCKRKLNVYVPYLYSSFCPSCKYIVSSAISGGSLRDHWEQLIEIHGTDRLSAEIERISMDFLMPSSSSEGKKLSATQLQNIISETNAQSFYSSELCTNYFTYTDREGKAHFVMYDNAHSIADKLHLARSLGFETAFLLYPEIQDIFTETASYCK